MRKHILMTVIALGGFGSAQLIGKTSSVLDTNFCKRYQCDETKSDGNEYVAFKTIKLTKRNAYMKIMRLQKKLQAARLYFFGEFESADGLSMANDFIYEIGGVFLKNSVMEACFRRAYKYTDVPNVVATISKPDGFKISVTCDKYPGEPMSIAVIDQ